MTNGNGNGNGAVAGTAAAQNLPIGLKVAEQDLDEPEKSKWYRGPTRPVPPHLVPASDQILVLRRNAVFKELSRGQRPEPDAPNWLDAHGATLLRQECRERVELSVPTRSPDLDFTVTIEWTCALNDPIAYLTATDGVSRVYHDEVERRARRTAKRFDPRAEADFEVELGERLRAWMRVRRSKVPGVVVKFGRVEVRGPEAATEDHGRRRKEAWGEDLTRLAHERGFAERRRAEEERTDEEEVLRRTIAQDRGTALIRIDNQEKVDEAHGAAADRGRVRRLESDSDYRMQQLEIDSEFRLREREAEDDRRMLEVQASHSQKRAELKAGIAFGELEAQAAEAKDAVVRVTESAQREQIRRELAADAESISAALDGKHGAAAIGIATGALSATDVYRTSIEESRSRVNRFYTLLRWLIDNDEAHEINLGEAGRTLIMQELAELGGGFTIPAENAGSRDASASLEPPTEEGGRHVLHEYEDENDDQDPIDVHGEEEDADGSSGDDDAEDASHAGDEC